MSNLASILGQIGPKWDIYLEVFKISVSTFWLGEPKCTETDLKKSQICPILDQSDPIWMPNVTSLGWGLVFCGDHSTLFRCLSTVRSRDNLLPFYPIRMLHFEGERDYILLYLYWR